MIVSFIKYSKKLDTVGISGIAEDQIPGLGIRIPDIRII